MSDLFDAYGFAFKHGGEYQRRVNEKLKTSLRYQHEQIRLFMKVFQKSKIRHDLHTHEKMIVFRFMFNLDNPIDIKPLNPIINEV